MLVRPPFEPRGRHGPRLLLFPEQSNGHEGATSSFLQKNQTWIVAIKVLKQKKQPSIFF
jgi:hypothetical protein